MLPLPASDYRKLSDEALIHRFVQRNDYNALNFIFERYGHLVLGICYAYFKESGEALKVTQEIFIQMIHKLPGMELIHFKTWLFQTTNDSCLLRQHNAIPLRKEEFQSNEPEEISMNTFLNEADSANKEKEIVQILAHMDLRARKCIELFYQQKNNL